MSGVIIVSLRRTRVLSNFFFFMSLFAKGSHRVVFLAGNWQVVNKGDKVPAKTICFLSSLIKKG